MRIGSLSVHGGEGGVVFYRVGRILWLMCLLLVARRMSASARCGRVLALRKHCGEPFG